MTPLRIAALLLLGLLTAPEPGVPQRLGASYALASSSHPELRNPQGFSAFARLPVGLDWLFRVAFSRTTTSDRKISRVCSSYVPHIRCAMETTDTNLTLSSLQLGAFRPLDMKDRVSVTIGGGGSFNLLGGGAVGESGRRADLLIPRGGQIGGFVSLGFSLSPIRSLRLALEGGYRLHWIGFSACSGGDPPQYDPFCDPGTFHEIDLGLSFPFR